MIEAFIILQKGSCENVMLRSRIVGSVPGLLDTLSCSSIVDLASSPMEEECAVPNILNECIRHLEQHGLKTLGIFRVSTSKKRIRQVSYEIIMDFKKCSPPLRMVSYDEMLFRVFSRRFGKVLLVLLNVLQNDVQLDSSSHFIL